MKKYKLMEWTDENIKRFWDYESNFKENYFTYQVGDKVINFLSKYIRGKKNILDFGCGSGYLIKHLLNMDMMVYGLDFSQESITKVNETYRLNENFKGANLIEHFIKYDQKFDCIILTEVIEHLDDKTLASTMAFIKSSLSENGVALITTPNNEDLSKSMVYCPESDVVFHRWQHVRSWSSTTLNDYLKQHFNNVETITTKFGETLTYKVRFVKIIKKILGRYENQKQPHLVAIVKNE